jgi:hypothetical protein
MQNKANFRKSQMNVNNVLTRDYDKMDTWSIRKNEPKTNPNEPNFKKAKMNVTSYITKGYGNIPPIPAPKKQSQIPKRQKPMQTLLPQRIMKNTAFSSYDKTNPIQSQTKPMLARRTVWRACPPSVWRIRAKKSSWFANDRIEQSAIPHTNVSNICRLTWQFIGSTMSELTF